MPRPPQLQNSITQSILVLRDQRVLLDYDLAELYAVETRRLNEQVRRNRTRFPADFVFELTAHEFENLKSQFATSNWGRPAQAAFSLYRARSNYGGFCSQQS